MPSMSCESENSHRSSDLAKKWGESAEKSDKAQADSEKAKMAREVFELLAPVYGYDPYAVRRVWLEAEHPEEEFKAEVGIEDVSRIFLYTRKVAPIQLGVDLSKTMLWLFFLERLGECEKPKVVFKVLRLEYHVMMLRNEQSLEAFTTRILAPAKNQSQDIVISTLDTFIKEHKNTHE